MKIIYKDGHVDECRRRAQPQRVAQGQQLAVLRQRLVQFNPCHAPGRARPRIVSVFSFRRSLTSLRFT